MRRLVVACALAGATGAACGNGERAAPPQEQPSERARPRPAEVAHLTLKVLGMT